MLDSNNNLCERQLSSQSLFLLPPPPPPPVGVQADSSVRNGGCCCEMDAEGDCTDENVRLGGGYLTVATVNKMWGSFVCVELLNPSAVGLGGAGTRTITTFCGLLFLSHTIMYEGNLGDCFITSNFPSRWPFCTFMTRHKGGINSQIEVCLIMRLSGLNQRFG